MLKVHSIKIAGLEQLVIAELGVPLDLLHLRNISQVFGVCRAGEKVSVTLLSDECETYVIEVWYRTRENLLVAVPLTVDIMAGVPCEAYWSLATDGIISGFASRRREHAITT